MKVKDGLVGRLYEVKTLPATVKELVVAIYDQKGKDKVSREDALDMADWLDAKYNISGYVPTGGTPPKQKKA